VSEEEPTKVVIEARDGKVILQFSQPTQNLVMDPANAFPIAEAMARAAHEAKFPGEILSDDSYIAHQVRLRVTEQLRDRMVARAAIVMGNLYQKKWTPGRASLELVDIVLAMAQGKQV
jgi:hypothetical protein